MITQEMIDGFAKAFEIDLTDGTNVPGVMGSLEMLARGEGEFPEKLMEEAPHVFSPLRDAYMAAHGVLASGQISSIEAMPEAPVCPTPDVEAAT